MPKEIGVTEEGFIEALLKIVADFIRRDRIEAAANVLFIVANNMSRDVSRK